MPKIKPNLKTIEIQTILECKRQQQNLQEEIGRQILKLRRGGWTLEEISLLTDMSKSTIHSMSNVAKLKETDGTPG